jgi:MFS family permease
VFFLAFGLSLLPLGVVVRYLRPAEKGKAPADPLREGVPRSSRVLRFTILGFLFGTTAGMLNLFPAIASVYFHLNPAQIGLIMLASALVIIVAGPAFGWLADRGSRTLVLMIRGFANIASSLMYLLFPSFWGVGASKLVDDTGKAAFRPAWGSVMAEVASEQPRRRAQVMALIDVGEDAGDAAGPILAGWLLVLGGLPLMLGVRCGLAAVTEVWTWWTTHRSAQHPTTDRSTTDPDVSPDSSPLRGT